jgi:hypothetical protein
VALARAGYDLPRAPLAYGPGGMYVPYGGLPHKPPIDLQPWIPPGSHVVKGKPSRTITSQSLMPAPPGLPSAFAPQMYGAPPYHMPQPNPYYAQQYTYPTQTLGPPHMQGPSHASHATTRTARTAPPQAGYPQGGYPDPWQSYPAGPVYPPPPIWGPTKPHAKAGAGHHKTPRITDPVRMSYPPAAGPGPWGPGAPPTWGPDGAGHQPGVPAWPPAGAPWAPRRASWAGGARPAAVPQAAGHGRHPTAAAPAAALPRQLLGLGQGGGRVDRETQRMQAVYQRQLERLKSLEESILDQMAARQQDGDNFNGTGGRSGAGWGNPHQQEFRVY